MVCSAISRIFHVKDKYSIKCAIIKNTNEREEALIHEIALSRPSSHMLKYKKKHLEIALSSSERVHCDSKPENDLLYQTSNDSYISKRVDFGLSFQIVTASMTLVKKSTDTVGHDASEVIVDNKISNKVSNIYALAFIPYELLRVKCFF
ncbi:unnamed protein product [Rotaria sp. Silwood2]|nr:unnamed protein product [Rotaria sp. Silwood2]CAF3336952.1 unnamed protein product [Rotaria sp. Silwood2]CAF3977857.1 unnamed protein product [Rotaria sp. Silwood2]CAF4114640.1 unnamed protein product [Rotaria sp. Silwood2]CAF4121776.1 unnamed protein product [Rotaria sp. Silwood2]